ncbi:tRNA pseudouridine(55) synthase TruB [Schaalia sp. 19OD2882]|uniref:tRNA pseudouridine(55) synthase TruB n=1 Tax=Schaalia sp. 19OD2882 TaxID=2794089 RepID=UPI001C1F0C75|nr:tRNA pseudouridine(55) synthase TruB [Schaalia sp. 19OD2882]QWW18988.1 tRNA pseudouridine(55) synthase TruB [Schaalia sp. 19OD2882]
MARRPDEPVPGILVVDKPSGMTSHDVVSTVRRLARTRKVGHAGSLDPMATGVLVIGIGKATRLLTHVTADSKTYTATIRLGVGTHSEDADGQVTSAHGCTEVDPAALETAMAALRGPIMQVPSAVSAIKVGGRRAHALVRAGQEVQLEARPVTVNRFEVLASPRASSALVEGQVRPVVDVDILVDCSSGTYVRALARDLGTAMGVGAHLTSLRRTRVGTFTLADALGLAALEEAHPRDGEDPLVAPLGLGQAVRRMFPVLHLDQDEAARFAHGNAPRRTPEEVRALAEEAAGGPMGVCTPEGHVMGLMRCDDDKVRTVLVF